MSIDQQELVNIVKQVEANMIGSGGVFEMAPEPVMGVEMPVFTNRDKSLREVVTNSGNNGDNIYIVCEDRRISYAEHLKLVKTVANNLKNNFNIQKGDRVAILADNYPEWIITFWATVSIGAIAVGINGWWTRKEILYGIELTEPKLMVADRKRFDRIAEDNFDFPCIVFEETYEEELLCNPADEFPDVPLEEDDSALILFTSGTTGKAKGAVTTHRALINFIASAFFNGFRMMMVKEERKARGETFEEQEFSLPTGLYTAPLFHLSGLYSGVLASLGGGLKTVWTPGRFDPEKILQLIEREKVNIWAALGSMAQRLMDHPDFYKYDVSSINVLGSGGAPTSKEMQERMQDHFPGAKGKMAVGYGLTESTGAGTTNWDDYLALHPDSAGRPFPGLQMEIHDESGNNLPPDTPGEICIRGACVMKEYWNNPGATAETITKDRWLRTGDMGQINEGGFLFINTRARDLILRNAENVYPVEVEHCLERHPSIKEAAVVGIDHPDWGQEVMAFIVPAPGTHPHIETIEKFCQENLAPFKVPTKWEIHETPLPRNAAGKILKNVLTGEMENHLVKE
jgi:acyl-CoA synthetase (AMP-forming)/AMP-acid ligase II